jgi:CrcB protein
MSGFPEIPDDPDLDVADPRTAAAAPRPAHLRPSLVALVALGGAGGSAARHGVQVALGSVDRLPVGTLAANVVGAFTLGLLLELLTRPGADHGRRRDLRLLLGTGFLGGFTTYSAFALETERLVATGEPALALSYALATVAGGFAASVLGVATGRTWRRRRAARGQTGRGRAGRGRGWRP